MRIKIFIKHKSTLKKIFLYVYRSFFVYIYIKLDYINRNYYI